ncbi:DUF3040 domain-containing protein [Kitasatospora sp. NPDC059146]|uniref:DUF3040 domain-containing protein n=1 Tax=unclassified Kitasatospora TaxID=2633591 RepID=UPI00367B049C
MNAPLTDRERHLLNGIEQHLRRDDPALDRLLGRRPSILTRIGHRPRLLAALAAALATLTAFAALCASTGGPATPMAAAGAATGALMMALVFRRLAALRTV